MLALQNQCALSVDVNGTEALVDWKIGRSAASARSSEPLRHPGPRFFSHSSPFLFTASCFNSNVNSSESRKLLFYAPELPIHSFGGPSGTEKK